MKFTVHEPLRHDGEDYPVGSTIDLSAKAAAGLVVAGVLLDPAQAKAEADAKAQAEADAKEGQE